MARGIERAKPKKKKTETEYVTSREFARRKGVSQQAVQTAIKQGRISAKKDKNGRFLIEWFSQSYLFDNARKKKPNTTRAKEAMYGDGITAAPALRKPTNPDGGGTDIESVDGAPSMQGEALTIWGDIDDADPTDADCMVEGADGVKRMNFDLREKKWKGIRQKAAAMTERGKLVKVDELMTVLSRFIPAVRDSVETMPRREKGAVSAVCESLWGKPEFESELEKVLEQEAERTLRILMQNLSDLEREVKDGKIGG